MDGKFIIDNLLGQEESDRLVFKYLITEEDLARIVTAMLNGKGGDIVLGVGANKRILGVPKESLDVSYLSLTTKIRPSAPIDIHIVDYDGKNVLLISVWEGAQKPYHCEGKIYQKVGDKIIVANSESISNLISEREKADFNWERLPLLGADFEDLDLDEVRNTMKEYAQMSNEVIKDEELYLMRKGLLKDGNLTNACIVLYGKNPARFLPQTRIKLSIFSSDSAADLVEARLFEGNLFKNAEALFQFIDLTYSKSVRIDGIHREEQWNYPRIAVREGIMNAIVHRDYNSAKGFMHVLLFPNRMEIASYGILSSMTTVINNQGGSLSLLRNPDIATQCYYRRLIEMMGTGIPRMLQDCKEHGFDAPIFEINEQIIKVIFPNVRYLRTQQDNAKMDLKTHYERVIEGVIEGVGTDIKGKMALILCELDKQPGLRTTGLSEKTNIPRKSIERYIKQLKDAGLIKFSGPSKTGGYFLADSQLRE